MKTRSHLVCFVFVVVLGMGVHAHPLQEGSEKHWKVVSTEALQALRASETKHLLVNVLPKIIHDKMHIPGSVNIPLGAVFGSQDLPKDKNALVIFYCMGKQCRYSPKAADIAHDMGYSNLLVYRDGLLGWRRAALPVESLVTYPAVDVPVISAAELVDINEAWILDLRPADHFVRGHITGSINIDLEVLHEKLQLIPKDRRVVLIDHKGKLTLTTGRFLASQGITNVVRLDGGINAWVKSDLPLDTSTGSTMTLPPRTIVADQQTQ
jgi:rhodanese-related sulfurtransferase